MVRASAAALFGSGCDTGGVVDAVEEAEPEANKNAYYELYMELFLTYEDMMDASEDAVLEEEPTCTRMGVTYTETASGNFEVMDVTCLELDPTGGGTSGGGECNSGFGGDPNCTLTPDPIDREVTQINKTDVCPSDPLADMEIRGTCDGVEGGRFGGRNGTHYGLDLLAATGTSLHATDGGTVRYAGPSNTDYGNIIVIETSQNTYHFFAHLSSVDVSNDDPVAEGDEIGSTGTSGNACESDCECGPPHVHVEVRSGSSDWRNATPEDPEDHLGTDFDQDGSPESDTC